MFWKKTGQWACGLLLSQMLVAPSLAAQLTVVDASTGQPLKDAAIEIYAPAPASLSSAALTVGDYQVVQRQATFDPHVLMVPVGADVSFPNRDTTRHHVYSFSPAKTFNLNLYLKETPPPVRFDQAGVVVLGCNIHDAMQAFVVVSDAPYRALTDDDGVASVELPPGRHRLRVWHPRLDDTHLAWWEGDVGADETLSVPLSLQASLPAVQAPSALERRFREALQHSQAH